MKVETHVHLTSDDQTRFPLNPSPVWPGLPVMGWPSEHTLTIERLLEEMDDAAIDRVVLVQGQTPYGFDNRYVLDCAQRHSSRAAATCSLDMLDDDPARRLRELVNEGAQAVRIFPEVVDGRTWLDDPKADAVWEEAGANGVVIDVCMRDGVPLARLSRLLAKYPAVPAVLDHLAFAAVTQSIEQRDAAVPLWEMADLSNLYLKLSPINIDALTRDGGSSEEFLRLIINQFGVNRMIWGTNYPVTHDRSYNALWTLGAESLAFLSESDRQMALGGTALSLWPRLG